ncbi:class I SAM-dependent methyltransferase [Oscillatoria sp. FACHB-1407]|uniref:class I SAM-dependent methyltransferase n=1 Tax=Oscillatoria sp. FACHB-1407 TaxID=2692847 RepID=UPI001684347C|nr:class I SAM-dependent methyltransferase [Oscillatoria sp. FACHB-1407]MBD2464238.1 class I SAM-dependent methyltransferase [Oscillatoria sp. FACHB-1407]
MEKLGQDLDSKQYWADVANQYSDALENDYHKHRLEVIRSLIPEELFQPGKQIFDFGCGDAILFPWFLETGGNIEGIDIAPEMIQIGQQRLTSWGFDSSLIQVADVNYLKQIGSASLDGLLSFNVLAYLTDEEELIFYQEASRIVKPGGYLIVTHSNELFDLFSLNHYTVEFFKDYFVTDALQHAKLSSLLTHSEGSSKAAYNVRENPLSYHHKLKKFNFKELKQGFINFHILPPPLLQDKTYPSTLNVDEGDRWKLMFMCSTFGSCAIRL